MATRTSTTQGRSATSAAAPSCAARAPRPTSPVAGDAPCASCARRGPSTEAGSARARCPRTTTRAAVRIAAARCSGACATAGTRGRAETRAPDALDEVPELPPTFEDEAACRPRRRRRAPVSAVVAAPVRRGVAPGRASREPRHVHAVPTSIEHKITSAVGLLQRLRASPDGGGHRTLARRPTHRCPLRRQRLGTSRSSSRGSSAGIATRSTSPTTSRRFASASRATSSSSSRESIARPTRSPMTVAVCG